MTAATRLLDIKECPSCGRSIWVGRMQCVVCETNNVPLFIPKEEVTDDRQQGPEGQQARRDE